MHCQALANQAMDDFVDRCMARVLELVREDNANVDAINALLSIIMQYPDLQRVYATVTECAQHGVVAHPLCDTYKRIKANPSYLFSSIFSTVRDWGDLDVVADLTSSFSYSYNHVKHLRCAVQTCEARTGLLSYVQRAMRTYASYVTAPWRVLTTTERWTIRDVLLIATRVSVCDLNVDHLMTLAHVDPKVGAKLVCSITVASCSFVVETVLDRVLRFFCYREIDGWTDCTLWHLSSNAPCRVASAIASHGKFFKLAPCVAVECMWNMVPYLKRYACYDNRPVEELLSADLPRAISEGVFTDCCIMGTAEWPAWTLVPHTSTTHHVLYYMAAHGRICANDAHVFAAIPDNVVDTLLEKDGCWPRLKQCVQLTRNWLRRAVWMLTLFKMRQRIDNHWPVADQVPESFRRVTAVLPLNALIMEYI